MDAKDMFAIVQKQLAIDLNCSVDDLNGEKDSILFVPTADNQGRRPFPRGRHHFEMASMGRAIIVSATPEILAIVRPQLDGQSRDEAFSMPFVHGHSIYYLPDIPRIQQLKAPASFAYELVERGRIAGLYREEGFRNALGYDEKHVRPDVLAAVARFDGKAVGIAGASEDAERMWQVGMDVLPAYRHHGLAAYLVNWLTLEVLKRGMVPYYGTASSNLASQRVAHRVGYQPAWICAYRGRFDGYETYPSS